MGSQIIHSFSYFIFFKSDETSILFFQCVHHGIKTPKGTRDMNLHKLLVNRCYINNNNNKQPTDGLMLLLLQLYIYWGNFL